MENNHQRPGMGFNLMSSGAETRRETTTGENVAKPKLIVKILDKIITVCIFMLFFGVPLFFTSLSFQGIAFEKQTYFYFWLLVALVVWAARGVILGELKIRKTPLDIPILIFFIAYALATFFSVDRWHSFIGFPGDPSRGLLSVMSLIIAYYLIFSHFNLDRLKWILKAVLISGSIISLWTLLGIMGLNFLPEKLMQIMPLSLVGSVSGLALFLGFMLPLVITTIFRLQGSKTASDLKKKTFTAILLVKLAVDIFLLFALYAFVPWIAVLIGIGLFLIFILSLIIRPIENWTWMPMVTFVLVMIILMIGNGFKVAKINLPVEVSPAYSLSWQIAKESLKDKLILGSGAATYGYDFSLHKPQDFNLNALYNLRFYQGTGVFFEALSTIGLLGSIALVLLLLTFLSVTIYLLASHKERDKVYSLGFVTSAIILIIAGVSTRAESAILIMSVLVGAVALATVMKESESEERNLHLSLKASPKFALTLAFVFMVVSAGVAYLFVFIGKIYAADLYAGSAIRQAQISEEGSIVKLAKAANFNNREGRYYTRIGQEFMVLANNEMLKKESERDVKLVENYLNNSILAAKRGQELMKKDVLAVETLAQIYENAGVYVPDSISLASATYQQALDLEPHSPNLILKLGQMKLSEAANSKETEQKKQLVGEAKDLFQKSIDKKQNFSQGYYQLALAKDALGDVSGAIESMTQALTYENNNINFVFFLARLYQERGEGDDIKIAEALFKQILGANDKEINTHLSLGMLYEKTSRKDDAIKEYKKVLELLPDGSDQAETQIQKMISNIQNGISNTAENIVTPQQSPAPAPTPVSVPATTPEAPPSLDQTTSPAPANENPNQ